MQFPWLAPLHERNEGSPLLTGDDFQAGEGATEDRKVGMLVDKRVGKRVDTREGKKAGMWGPPQPPLTFLSEPR